MLLTDKSSGGEVAPAVELVAGLVREQAPSFAGLPISVSNSAGSSNWVFRLGDTMAVRLPRSRGYSADLETEVAWLPRIAAATTTPTPELVLRGEPSATFALPWAIVTWLEGDRPGDLGPVAQQVLATDLAAFCTELHGVDVSGVSAGPQRWGYRCDDPVTEQTDAWAEKVADGLADIFDPAAVREAWRRVRDVPARTTPLCLVHTDLSDENLLTRPDGHLAGVIDFGSLGVGDRAADLLYAWNLFDAPAREILRQATRADEATWLRARAYAFVGPGLLTLLNYRDTMPGRAARLTRLVRSIAAEVGVDLAAP
ncbi:aminoglycoside phosphotransferase family protein [Arsenicicoccus cauae]|uniref:aminoglycoside phosphotransferase family protein n=1 Tax=Arsenicicoccus cauae TaxID=2663847 RepID=UPI00370D8C5E